MKKELLENTTSRVLLRSYEYRPRSTEPQETQIAASIRPAYSNLGPTETALIGGKIERRDFWRVLNILQYFDPNYVPTQEQFLKAAQSAARREFLEETLHLLPHLLFAGSKKNEAGYLSYAFAVEKLYKPRLSVPSDSKGIVWINQEEIVRGERQFFADHLVLAQMAIRALDKQGEKK